MEKDTSCSPTKESRANSWIIGLVIVEFDIDEGQVVKYMCPEGCMSERESKSISHMSFPDSNAFTKAEGTCEYVFRLKRDKSSEGSKFCFGYTFFCQNKDTGNTRGYRQQSLVVLTQYPFIYFFSQLARTISSFCFPAAQNTSEILQQAIEEILNWPPPQKGVSYSLQILSGTIQLEIPPHARIENHFETQDKNSQRLTEETKLSPQKKYKESGEQIVVVEEQKDGGFQENIRLNKEGIPSSEAKQEIQTNHSSDTKGNDSETQADKILDISPKKTHLNGDKNENQMKMGQQQIPQKVCGMQSILSAHDCSEQGLFQEFNLFQLLGRDKIHNLWKLWEVALTNSPLMVMADTPEYCTSLVFGAISLISPLDFTADFRPYFTIYDEDYKCIKEECDRGATKAILLGVTNPFFLKTLQKFPVIFRLDSAFDNLSSLKSKKSNEKSYLFEVTNKSNKLYIGYDKNLEKMMLPQDTAEVSAINNSLLRKHFRTLTTQFIQTFEDYFQSQRNEIKVFDQKEFLKQLEGRKFAFQDLFEKKKRIVSLYEKFIRSSNFLSYIKTKPNVYFTKAPMRS